MKNFDFVVSRRRRDENGERICRDLFTHHKGNSSTQSNPTTSTDITDNRVAASEGSISAGSGASVSVQSSDAAVVKSTGDAIARIAESGIEGNAAVSHTAIQENSDMSKAALNSNVAALQEGADLGKVAITAVQSQGRDALDFGESVVQRAINAATASQLSANDLIQHTNDSFTQKLVENQGTAPSTSADNLVKYITIASGLIGLALIFKGEKK